MKENRLTLGERIRELREEKDISVRELAKRIGKSAPFVSDIELGRRHPSDDVLKDLADRLGTTVEDLRSHDARAPVQELKRKAASDPAMGFALRRIVDQGVTPSELQEFLDRRQRGKKT